jgi:hypothetical protein
LLGPTNQTAFVDSNLTLSCETTGDPLPTVQWQKRNGTGGRWVQVPKRNRERWFYRDKAGDLVFQRLLASDTGWYRCSAENSRTSVFSAPAQLTIHAKAEIVQGPKDADVLWGTEFNLECEVVGIPFPSRSWWKNGQLIIDTRTEKANSQARLRINATENATYTCMAENVHKDGYTNVSRSATVRVRDYRCVPYTSSFCRDVIGVDQHVYVRASVFDAVNSIESRIIRLVNESSRVADGCREAARRAACRRALPECGLGGSPKPLCSEACTILKEASCRASCPDCSRLATGAEGDDLLLPNCSSLPSKTSRVSCSLVDDVATTTAPPNAMNDCTSSGTVEVSPLELDNPSQLTTEVKIAIFIVAPLCVVVFVIVGTLVALRLAPNRRRRRAFHKDHSAVVSGPANSDSIEIDVSRLPLNDAYIRPASDDAFDAVETNPLLDRFEFDRNGIHYCEDLRTGAFGPVFVAQAPGITGGGGESSSSSLLSSSPTFVVVKTLRSDATVEARLDFVRIAEVLARLIHPNIVRLLGVCLRADPLCLIVEFMPGHDLSDFLRASAPQHFIVRYGVDATPATSARIRPPDLVSAARQLADAMEYVSGSGFVHRDLAARNCLVGNPNSSRLDVKLSDFGLAVDLASREFHVGDDDEEIPIRWMPPESIQENRFSVASDVWSFGVLMWEIFTFGAQPYEDLSPKQVIRYVVAGRTLHCPEHASSALYDLMRWCWARDPSDRPTFDVILRQLTRLEDVARADVRFV